MLNSVCTSGVRSATPLHLWLSGSRPSVTVLLFVDNCLHRCPGSGVSPWLMVRVQNFVPYRDM